MLLGTAQRRCAVFIDATNYVWALVKQSQTQRAPRIGTRTLHRRTVRRQTAHRQTVRLPDSSLTGHFAARTVRLQDISPTGQFFFYVSGIFYFSWPWVETEGVPAQRR